MIEAFVPGTSDLNKLLDMVQLSAKSANHPLVALYLPPPSFIERLHIRQLLPPADSVPPVEGVSAPTDQDAELTAPDDDHVRLRHRPAQASTGAGRHVAHIRAP